MVIKNAKFVIGARYHSVVFSINQNKPLAIISEGYLSIKIYDVRREYFDEYVVWNWSDESDIRISKLRGNKFRVGRQWYSLNDALRYNFF